MENYRSNSRGFCCPQFPKVFTYEHCVKSEFTDFQDSDLRWYLSRIPSDHALNDIYPETVFGPPASYYMSFNSLFSKAQDDELYDSSLQAWTHYLNGGWNAEHCVDGTDQPLMTPIKLIALSHTHFHNAVFDFVDELDEIKELIAPCFQADQAVIRHGDRYIRGIRCTFTMPLGTMDLLMSNEELLFHIIEFSKISMPLYIPEQSYESAEAAIADLNAPDKLDLSKVFQLLFGALEDSEAIINDFPLSLFPPVEDI